MRASRDWRLASTVTLTMHITEFREHVEWLEMLDPRDGATVAWRAELDKIDPPKEEEDGT